MASDLNFVGSNGQWDYSNPGSRGYNVPDIVCNDPSSRKLKVLTIRAGLSGIQMTYQTQKYTKMSTTSFMKRMLDWEVPGSKIDIRYLEKVCDVFDLRKYMTLNTEVTRAEWQNDIGKWRVSLKQNNAAGEEREFVEECDLLLYATGILNNYK
ncbi:hypothetical protein NX059_011137 [Plenodomus lindquistii]|nr:hypothetical protein NX059_011137 [Plenodomus lindquistii]